MLDTSHENNKAEWMRDKFKRTDFKMLNECYKNNYTLFNKKMHWGNLCKMFLYSRTQPRPL